MLLLLVEENPLESFFFFEHLSQIQNKKPHTTIENADAKTQQLVDEAMSSLLPQESQANEDQEKLIRLI